MRYFRSVVGKYPLRIVMFIMIIAIVLIRLYEYTSSSPLSGEMIAQQAINNFEKKVIYQKYKNQTKLKARLPEPYFFRGWELDNFDKSIILLNRKFKKAEQYTVYITFNPPIPFIRCVDSDKGEPCEEMMHTEFYQDKNGKQIQRKVANSYVSIIMLVDRYGNEIDQKLMGQDRCLGFNLKYSDGHNNYPC